MMGRRDLPDEMRNLILDRASADRLLSACVDPDDAPPGYAEVATLLNAVAGSSPFGLGRESVTVAAMSAAVRSNLDADLSPSRRHPVKRFLRTKVVTLAVGASLVGTSGLAFAGALPPAAQSVASAMLSKIGITVPGPNVHAGTHPASRGGSASHVPDTTTSQPSATKGSLISGLAKTTTATGVSKGAAVSTAASNGLSQAGQHDQAGTNGQEGTHTPTSTPPVQVPNGGGTGTGDTASGGASTSGTTTAGTNS
jgi:hypothetical protein